MPYVQSERSILYSLHRSACSRGLQAGRERELVPGLCVERCGLLETLLSGGGGACVRIYVSLCVYSSVFLSLETAPISPFIVEGGTGVIHVFAMRRAEVACPSPIAYYYGGMVNGAVLSLMHWSNAPVTPDLVRCGRSSDGLVQGMADDVRVAVC